MPKVSDRSVNSYESPIRKLAPLATKAEQEGKRVFYLNIGQPDIKTPAAALDAVRTADLEILKYAPSQGIPSYRHKLVDYYSKFGVNLFYDDVMVTTGASEAILFLMTSGLDRGDEVIIPEPFYANYIGFAKMADVNIKTLTSTIDTAYALPDISEFEKAINSKTKAIFICNPNNPTGALYSKKALEELGALVRKYDLFLFVDEVYREFCYDGQSFHSVLNLEGCEENVVVIDSISKRYSSCGARVGALVTRNHEIIKMVTKYAQLRLSSPTFGQILAEAALDLDDSYLDEVKAEYDKRRMLLVNRLQAMDGVVCNKPGGAFYVFVQLPIKNSEHFCEWLLTSFDYNNNTVMLSPGTGFYATPGLGENEVRIAYVLNTEDLDKAMDCIQAALSVYPERIELARSIGAKQ